jgi:glycerol-3-phosphate acyltransferase PlsY
MSLSAVLSVAASYLIGSVPFAFLVARATGTADLRRVGSGSLGATNVLRVSGVGAGIIVLLLDIAKGAAGVVTAYRIDGAIGVASAAGLAAIVGHVYPVWLRFHGGKGVATACGVFLVLAPAALLPAVAVFAAAAWMTRLASVASVLASVTLVPLVYAIQGATPVLAAAASAVGLIVFRHRANLARVAAGTERRLGARV